MAEAALKQEGLAPEEVDAIAGGPAEKVPDKSESTVDPKVRTERAPKPDKKPDEAPKTVPHEAFHEERTKRQAAEREFKAFKKEQEEKEARLQQRLDMLFQVREQPQQKAPDLNKAPLEFVRTVDQRVAALEQETQAQKQAREQAEAAQREEGNLWSNYRASGREFTKANPDFPEAYNHLLANRVQELEIMGYDGPTIQTILKSDEFNLAQHAFKTGVDPAEVLYKWAKQRGYTGPKANGQAAPQPSQIDRLKAAQDASETLSKGGAATATQGRITLETLYRMSEEELGAFIKRMNSKDPEGYEKFKRRLEGGQ